jgi:pyruvate/2-oxoacid:ferredoxin oxidoreductase beta subunit
MSPCNSDWRAETIDSIMLSRLTVEISYWPLYEVKAGKWTVNYDPKEEKAGFRVAQTPGQIQAPARAGQRGIALSVSKAC